MADSKVDTSGKGEDEDLGLDEDEASSVLDKARGKNSKTEEDDSDDDGQEDESGKDSTDWKAEAEKWKKLSRKHEKDFRTTKGALDKYEDANKSETERLQEKASRNEEAAAKATARMRKLEIAAETAPDNATPAQLLKIAKRMSGEDDDALEEDAKELWADFGPAAGASGPKKQVPGKPTPNLKGGGRSQDNDDEETDPRKLAAMITRAR